jgi:hypothetical protein
VVTWGRHHKPGKVTLPPKSDKYDASTALRDPEIVRAHLKSCDVISLGQRAVKRPAKVALKLRPRQCRHILCHEGLGSHGEHAANEVWEKVAPVTRALLPPGGGERLTGRASMKHVRHASMLLPVDAFHVAFGTRPDRPVRAVQGEGCASRLKGVVRGNVAESSTVDTEVKSAPAAEKGEGRETMILDLGHEVGRVEVREVD